jgi:hypothetical protein
MRDPSDRERRRNENRWRFILICAGVVVAVMLIWTVDGSLALMAAKLRVFG